MKMKFAKVLGLCAAFTMLFSMNVAAVGSTSTDNTDAGETATEEATAPAEEFAAGVTANNTVVIDGKAVELEVKVAPVTNATVATAETQAKAIVSETASVVKAFDVSLPEGDYSKGVQVTMNVPNIVAGQKIAVLHQKADGTWESLTVNNVANGAVTATFTSFSPVAIVAYDASPKTGSSFPAAMAVALVALAGAAVCFKKHMN